LSTFAFVKTSGAAKMTVLFAPTFFFPYLSALKD